MWGCPDYKAGRKIPEDIQWFPSLELTEVLWGECSWKNFHNKLDWESPACFGGDCPFSCEDKCKAEVSEGSRVWSFRYSKQGESGSLILYNGFDNPQNLLVMGKKQENKHNKQNEKQQMNHKVYTVPTKSSQ